MPPFRVLAGHDIDEAGIEARGEPLALGLGARGRSRAPCWAATLRRGTLDGIGGTVEAGAGHGAASLAHS